MVCLPVSKLARANRIRDQCEIQVAGTSSNIYRGYRSVESAQAAYNFARAQGLTRPAGANDQRYRIEWSAPRMWDYTGPTPLSEGVTEVRWYVVYIGLKPGVYASTLVISFVMWRQH